MLIIMCNRERDHAIGGGTLWLGERLGSGDGEREALLTRQIAFEPLPASVLFAFVGVWWLLMCRKWSQ